jgi:glucose-1-phosphate adenylyltransferase
VLRATGILGQDELGEDVVGEPPPMSREGVQMADPRILGIVLAGGEGKRLAPLTADRAKPAVPFAGLYRLIDFALSNLVNAGVLRIAVLTQYKSHSLDRHISTTWRLSNLLGNYVTPVPAQQRLGPRWYTGSADAIFQSLNLINDERPDIVVVFGADHVYRMDPEQMWRQHVDGGAGVTVAGIPVPRSEATAFGVIQTAQDGIGIEAFLEKPADPPGLPGRPDETYASMGNYVFSTEALLDALHTDAANEDSKHDMGGDIVPLLVGQNAAQVYDFQSNEVPGEDPAGERYWRDVGTIDSYFDAHMDLCATVPAFDLYNDRWPILTHIPSHPPAKFVHDDGDRVGRAIDSIVSNGVIVSGASVRESVLSPGVHLHSWVTVERSVLMDGVDVAREAVVHDAILDKNVRVAPGVEIGVNKDDDRDRGFAVSANGVTVVGKGVEVAK